MPRPHGLSRWPGCQRWSSQSIGCEPLGPHPETVWNEHQDMVIAGLTHHMQYILYTVLTWHILMLSVVVKCCQHHCPNLTWHHLTWGSGASGASVPAGAVAGRAETWNPDNPVAVYSKLWPWPQLPTISHCPTISLQCRNPCANEVRRRLWLLPDQWRTSCRLQASLSISSNWCIVEQSSSAFMEDWWYEYDRNERSGLKG